MKRLAIDVAIAILAFTAGGIIALAVFAPESAPSAMRTHFESIGIVAPPPENGSAGPAGEEESKRFGEPLLREYERYVQASSSRSRE